MQGEVSHDQTEPSNSDAHKISRKGESLSFLNSSITLI